MSMCASERSYKINEIFYSLQGEGVRTGTANVFVRFSGCNLQCNGTVEGEAYQPVCDTEFLSNTKMTAAQIVEKSLLAMGDGAARVDHRWVIFTGGEPSIQLDTALIDAFKAAKFKLAIETNGTHALPDGIDWITVSPKTAEHTLKQLTAHEVKYVRYPNMGLPKTVIKAEHYLLSPAFDANGVLTPDNLNWCLNLTKQDPKWRLSVQLHKIVYRVR